MPANKTAHEMAEVNDHDTVTVKSLSGQNSDGAICALGVQNRKDHQFHNIYFVGSVDYKHDASIAYHTARMSEFIHSCALLCCIRFCCLVM